MSSFLRPPGGGITFVAFLWILAGAFGMYALHNLPGGPGVLFWTCAILFVTGIGLWLRHRWARSVALILSGFGLIAAFVRLGMFGLSFKGALKVLSSIYFIHVLWVWDVRRDEPLPEVFGEDVDPEGGDEDPTPERSED